MMISMETYVRRGQRLLRRLTPQPPVRQLLGRGAWVLAGFVLSAASLGGSFQSLPLALVCSQTGWPAALAALGGGLGYRVFWGAAAGQGALWLVLALPPALLLGKRELARSSPLLLPSVAALIAAATGVVYQNWMEDTTPVTVYLLRVGLAMGAAWLYGLEGERRGPAARWITEGLGVLALVQVLPSRTWNPGVAAAGLLAVRGAFPAAALAGLALDLAKLTPTPMAASLSLAYFARLIPGVRRSGVWIGLGGAYLLVSALTGGWDPALLPALLLGGGLGLVLPGQRSGALPRGETGVLQVRLELAAEVLAQTEQLLLEAPQPPVDEAALVTRAAQRACGSCPCRKTCRDRETAASLPAKLLGGDLLEEGTLPMRCRKTGRLLTELRRSREQLRLLRGERTVQGEYRAAVIQQYAFLSEYLRELSDGLPRSVRSPEARFRVEVAVSANRPEGENGDVCLWFPGTACRYYVLLCDGMGTGMGAAEEGNTAGKLLRRLLTAGFPAAYALRSLNSLCALRSRAGAATVDLAEIALESGKTTLYKWGAAPSYLLRRAGAEKIGTAGPPPGLSVADGREMVERLSLHSGEALVLLSDGVGGEDAIRGFAAAPDTPPGEMAAEILERGEARGADDATVAVIRLSALSLVT